MTDCEVCGQRPATRVAVRGGVETEACGYCAHEVMPVGTGSPGEGWYIVDGGE